MSVIICLVTCPSQEVAGSLAKGIVDRQLAACVNILPGVQSIYRWQGSVCVEQECLMIIKSTSERQDDLKRAILEEHPYEVPEFIALDTLEVSGPYAQWIMDSVGHKGIPGC